MMDEMDEITLVSMDWDYCIPIHVINDWGHDENPLFMEMIWGAREWLLYVDEEGKMKRMPLDELKPDFTGLPTIESSTALGVSESHASALDFFGKALERSEAEKIILYHYDLHHDVWNKNVEYTLAENWLYNLVMKTGVDWKIHHVKPSWVGKCGYGNEPFLDDVLVPELKEASGNRVEWNTEIAKVHDIKKSDATFLCRSGCWTPPHLDHEFARLFIEYLASYSKPVETVPCYSYLNYNPIKARY